MSMNLARAVTARSVASCLIGLFFLTGCSNPGQITLARPQHQGQHQGQHLNQALSSGYPGTASFDVPVVDPNTWQGTPMGTGTWSTSATPPAAGGPSGIGFLDSQAGSTLHYLMIGNFTAGTGNFFGIISDGAPLKVGTSSINNTTLFAGIFDSATGNPVALASAGTLTLTAAGVIGGRITGTFSGTLDDATAIPACTTNAQCRSNEVCLSGACVPQGCTSNAQCATGQVCQAGQCVTAPPACTTNAQCGAGKICQAGQCVNGPPPCTSNAQCGAGQVCQAGQCVTAPPGCTSNAQCGAGQVCQAGQCVTSPPVSCSRLQGDGNFSGTVGNVAVCSAFGSGAVSVPSGVAAVGDDGSGLSLFVMDPQVTSMGAVLPLSACPSAPGTVSVSNAIFWDQKTAGGVTFYASRPASSATVTFTQVAGGLKGTFVMSLGGGGTINGAFDVR